MRAAGESVCVCVSQSGRVAVQTHGGSRQACVEGGGQPGWSCGV